MIWLNGNAYDPLSVQQSKFYNLLSIQKCTWVLAVLNSEDIYLLRIEPVTVLIFWHLS